VVEQRLGRPCPERHVDEDFGRPRAAIALISTAVVDDDANSFVARAWQAEAVGDRAHAAADLRGWKLTVVYAADSVDQARGQPRRGPAHETIVRGRDARARDSSVPISRS
jgi:hypothetical protein